MFDLSDAERQVVSDIINTYISGDYRVFVFGSRAKLTNHAHSDLDIVIQSAEPIDLSTLALVSDAFSESDLPFRVDFVDWNRIGKEFRSHIQQHWVPWNGAESENRVTNP
ncbi:nucleotidyltransferase family protein [Alkalimarinus coralli]|uniref:nucleotidyltransferase family protein n=1 Tax=Alkalimarinus coralli TaxID=2935863 RepID=UPI00202B0091|nr:nucleotidyltransferase domain-containing protein [Alkalimarinus coralli]